MVKLVLTLPSETDVEKFMDAVITQVQGRYHYAYYFNGLATPSITYRDTCGWLKGNTRYSIYEIDAAEVEPAIISVIADFKKFGDFDFDFRVNGKSIGVDWWRPTADEMLDEGYENGFETVRNGEVHYDVAAAEYAADIYNAKITALENGAKKIA